VVLAAHELGGGSGAPVVALHGVRNHGRRFRRLAADAFGTARVIAPDLRGHGDSGWEPPWDAATHVADVLDTLDALGVDGPVEVVAHSFGGLVACGIAATAPDRVRSLTLLDPAAGLDPRVCAPAAAADLAGDGRAASWASRGEAEEAWSAVRPPSGQWARDEDLDAFLTRDHDGRYRLRFSRAAAIAAWSEMARPVTDLGAWRGPVTLVTAERDPYVSDALRGMLRDTCGPLLTEVGIDSGHILMWDAPQETARVVAAARPLPRG
jgi:lipase